MLELRDCSACYGSRTVLAGVSLAVPSGKTACIIGPTGCGKSTLLALAAGLKAPSTGEVLLDNERVGQGDHRVSVILQQYGLFPWFTVRENVELGLRFRGSSAKERSRVVEAELARVKLVGFAGRYPAELSGGQQQRTAIARSLSLCPKLLLMDEPFSALDTLSRESLQELVLDLFNGMNMTAALVTHDIEEAVFLGSTVFLLAGDPGKIVRKFENPGQGKKDYRGDPSFFDLCGQIRLALEPYRVL
jgi:NitT/TauT family transport system ATP-binding protein